MKIALFGGSFDPVHSEHIRMAQAAVSALGLDKLIVMPSYQAPHKAFGAHAEGKYRLEMCKIAFGKHDFAEVSDYELKAGGTSYTYLTCRAFAEKYPGSELFFLVGADMLSDFFTWKAPDDILAHATIAACGRGEALDPHLHEMFLARFGKDFAEIPFTGEAVSSTEIRVALAFGKRPNALCDGVYDYIRTHGLYAYPAIAPALALETEARREHSLRVAKLACRRARSLGIGEEKALLAAALHDCAKSIPAESPYLAGFTPPDEVPAPVLHQYTGAYIAEHTFGIRDEEILDAIRYHASGREDMTPLGKLIYLSDLLEEERRFPMVEYLRDLFWQDPDRCLEESLQYQLDYLQKTGGPIYWRSAAAYEWAKAHLKQ